MTIRRQWCAFLLALTIARTSLFAAGFATPTSSSSSNTPDPAPLFFSWSAHQKARGLATSQALDATRLHFQILFLDDDNGKGRLAEKMVAQLAEYNDALFILFPSSATVVEARSAPMGADAPVQAVQACDALGLSPCDDVGTAFDLANLDDYDLIVCFDDALRSWILNSVSTNDNDDHFCYYAHKVKVLGDFLQLDFCGSIRRDENPVTVESLLNMMEPTWRDLVEPYAQVLVSESHANADIFRNVQLPTKSHSPVVPPIAMNEQGAVVPNFQSWPLVQAALLLASAGLVRFCLDALDAHFEAAFDILLERNVKERVEWSVQLDEQLALCNAAVCGYFSPQQRRAKFDLHLQGLEDKQSKT